MSLPKQLYAVNWRDKVQPEYSGYFKERPDSILPRVWLEDPLIELISNGFALRQDLEIVAYVPRDLYDARIAELEAEIESLRRQPVAVANKAWHADCDEPVEDEDDSK